jgi:hypothetical protein
MSPNHWAMSEAGMSQNHWLRAFGSIRHHYEPGPRSSAGCLRHSCKLPAVVGYPGEDFAPSNLSTIFQDSLLLMVYSLGSPCLAERRVDENEANDIIQF